jgi:hypothetical protein
LDAEPEHEEVHHAVEQIHTEVTFGAAAVLLDKVAGDEVLDEEEATREEVRPAVEQSPSEPNFGGEAMRESVRLAVERAKDEMLSGGPGDAGDEAAREAGSDEDAAREDVRRAVAQMRSEMAVGTATVSLEKPAGDEDMDDEEAKREEVRRAVERTRSDLTFGGRLSMYDDTAPPEADGLQPEETHGLFAAFSGADSPSWQGREPELLGLPASIIIEDSEGRVELARVYDTLNRVDRSQAALLNYTPHSVTVGLAVLERLPEPDVMMAAVKHAFGRACRVTTEGTKMSVKIGDGEKAA